MSPLEIKPFDFTIKVGERGRTFSQEIAPSRTESVVNARCAVMVNQNRDLLFFGRRRILALCESRERWRENEKGENEKQKWLDGLLAHRYLPLHRNDRFSSSALEPGSVSRHLHAGHHL